MKTYLKMGGSSSFQLETMYETATKMFWGYSRAERCEVIPLRKDYISPYHPVGQTDVFGVETCYHTSPHMVGTLVNPSHKPKGLIKPNVAVLYLPGESLHLQCCPSLG
jgi:hypothetical protein